MENKTAALSIDLINGILNYLGTKPFIEVANLIKGIQEQVGPQVQGQEAPAEKPAE